MKNTKSRKKILLSSIAMLLVALVALGSATYAWFTLNKTVYADTIQVQVSAAKGLQITGSNPADTVGSNTGWGPKYSFAAANVDKQLTPASFAIESKKITATGLYSTEFTDEAHGRYVDKDTNATATFEDAALATPITTADTDSGNVNAYSAAYEVGVRSKDHTSISGVNLNLEITADSAVQDYLRVAVIPQAGATLDLATDEVEKLFGTEETGAKALKGPKATPTGVDQTIEAITFNTSTNKATGTVSVGAVTTAQYYTILVWFEGEDADCIADHAAGTVQVKATFQA